MSVIDDDTGPALRDDTVPDASGSDAARSGAFSDDAGSAALLGADYDPPSTASGSVLFDDDAAPTPTGAVPRSVDLEARGELDRILGGAGLRRSHREQRAARSQRSAGQPDPGVERARASSRQVAGPGRATAPARPSPSGPGPARGRYPSGAPDTAPLGPDAAASLGPDDAGPLGPYDAAPLGAGGAPEADPPPATWLPTPNVDPNVDPTGDGAGPRHAATGTAPRRGFWSGLVIVVIVCGVLLVWHAYLLVGMIAFGFVFSQVAGRATKSPPSEERLRAARRDAVAELQQRRPRGPLGY